MAVAVSPCKVIVGGHSRWMPVAWAVNSAQKARKSSCPRITGAGASPTPTTSNTPSVQNNSAHA